MFSLTDAMDSLRFGPHILPTLSWLPLCYPFVQILSRFSIEYIFSLAPLLFEFFCYFLCLGVFRHYPLTPSFIDRDRPTYICRQQKANYGLKQAPRVWYMTLCLFVTKVLHSHMFLYMLMIFFFWK